MNVMIKSQLIIFGFLSIIFLAVLKKLSIMLSIMPIATAIMPQFNYIVHIQFYCIINQISIVRLQSVIEFILQILLIIYAKMHLRCSYF